MKTLKLFLILSVFCFSMVFADMLSPPNLPPLVIESPTQPATPIPGSTTINAYCGKVQIVNNPFLAPYSVEISRYPRPDEFLGNARQPLAMSYCNYFAYLNCGNLGGNPTGNVSDSVDPNYVCAHVANFVCGSRGVYAPYRPSGRFERVDRNESGASVGVTFRCQTGFLINGNYGLAQSTPGAQPPPTPTLPDARNNLLRAP